MAGIKKGFLEASSLLEVVVAIVIISIVSSISLMIYMNTVTSMANNTRYHLETKASYYLSKYEELTEEEQLGFTDDSGNEFIFHESETEYEHLKEITLTLTDSLEYYHITRKKLLYQWK